MCIHSYTTNGLLIDIQYNSGEISLFGLPVLLPAAERDKMRLIVLVICLVLAAFLCGNSHAGSETPIINAAELMQLQAQYRRPKAIPYPDNNPYTKDKIRLGHKLFFDPRLSVSGTRSCATCHNPSLDWTDGLPRAVSLDGKPLRRKTPTILNLAWDELYFWDGRAESLEDQATKPIEAKDEMGGVDMHALMAGFVATDEYARLFAKSFPEDKEPVSVINLAKALAAYERTIVSGPAPFDRWIDGKEKAISEAAQRGFVVFNGKANCAACHSGWRFSDGSFHDIGLPGVDAGRGKVVNLLSMQNAFKTVGLRNIDRRRPYMHDGSLATLEEVVDHYDHSFIRRASLSSMIKPLFLTVEEKKDLVAFLQSLTSDEQPISVPTLPPPLVGKKATDK